MTRDWSSWLQRRMPKNRWKRSWGGLLLALMVGLTLAVLVAVVASRRMTRPLRRAADAAEQLAAGQRDVRIEPEGPTEVAELAESMNRLASALAVSENRQREFLLSVSHELRTPLTAVQGYAEAIAEEVVPAEEVPQAAEVLTAESKRLERLVADLLDLSRLGAADLKIMRQPVNLTDLLSDAAQVWRDRCARVDVQFRAEIPATPVLADTDPLRYRQILDNLAENALRVTPADAPIVFALSAHDHWAVLQVRDGGPGLAPQDLDGSLRTRCPLHPLPRGSPGRLRNRLGVGGPTRATSWRHREGRKRARRRGAVRGPGSDRDPRGQAHGLRHRGSHPAYSHAQGWRYSHSNCAAPWRLQEIRAGRELVA